MPQSKKLAGESHFGVHKDKPPKKGGKGLRGKDKQQDERRVQRNPKR